MPNNHDNRNKRKAEARAIANQPQVIYLRTCETCGAANPTRPGEPPPEQCASCGTTYRPPASWAGKNALRSCPW